MGTPCRAKEVPLLCGAIYVVQYMHSDLLKAATQYSLLTRRKNTSMSIGFLPTSGVSVYRTRRIHERDNARSTKRAARLQCWIFPLCEKRHNESPKQTVCITADGPRQGQPTSMLGQDGDLARPKMIEGTLRCVR